MSAVRVVVAGGAVGDAIAARLRAALGDDERGADEPGADERGADAPDAALALADAVLALDAAALTAARAAGVRVRIAVTRGLAARFDGSLADATHVALPHVSSKSRAGAHAALFVGLLSAEEHAPQAADARSAARLAAGIDAESRVVVVDAHELRDVGLRDLLIQLALAEPSPAVLFDVGAEVALATALRAELPGHALDAFLFAGVDRTAQLPLADLAIGRASGALVERAFLAELPVLPFPREDSADDLALGVLLACGAAPPPRTMAVLSVALDAALRAPLRVRELDAAGTPARLVEAARDAVAEVRAGRGPRAVGLPFGLERIGSRDDAPRASATPGDPPRDASDLDARIDAELAALKKRL